MDGWMEWILRMMIEMCN
jgi:hypothetical protein